VRPFLKILAVLLLLATPALRVYGVSWAILPVKFNGYAQPHLKTGPVFNPDDPETGWEMARLLRLYLKSNFVHSVLPMESVKRAYKKNDVGYNSDLTTDELKSVAYDLDCDKIVLTEVFFSKDTVRVQSRIYFTQSGTISDTVTLTGETLYETLGKSLQQRFQFRGNSFISRDDRYHFIFGLDASGKNYNEIRYLTNLIGELDIDQSSGVSVDGYGKEFLLQATSEKSTLLDYINHVRPQSTDTTDRLYIHLLANVLELTQKSRAAEKNKIAVLVVSGAPKKIESRQKVNGFLRRLGRKSRVLILGNGKLSPEERNYWSLLTNASPNIMYKDILYKQKIGLSDGNAVYLLKSGDKLLESNTGDVAYSHEIFIDKEEIKNFNQDTIVKIFESTTQKTVVSPGKAEVDYKISLLADTIKVSSRESGQSRARVLILVENKPFWIDVPYKSILNEDGRQRLETGSRYYFLLNLKPAGQGMPFRNSPDFAEVLTPSEISSILLLDVNAYLKNPERYLEKSIAGTSLYIVFGVVKDVRVERKRVF